MHFLLFILTTTFFLLSNHVERSYSLFGIESAFTAINLPVLAQKLANVAQTLGFNDAPGWARTLGSMYSDMVISHDPNEIIFQLNPAKGVLQTIHYNDPATLHGSSFDNTKPTMFLIHGFTPTSDSAGTLAMFDAISDAYFMAGVDCNIVRVNWEPLARPKDLIKVLNYPAAVGNVPIAGNRTGEFITFMVNYGGLNLKKLHVIGFSLGAHVAGISGEKVQHLLGDKVGRITGLDPAAPEFWTTVTNVQGRLDPTDGDFVVAVHTNIKQNGIYFPIAAADFYPNKGGPIQPWCSTTLLRYSAVWNIVCSHSSAYRYFAMSIQKLMLACPCEGLDQLEQCQAEWERTGGQCANPMPFGARTPPTARGVFYLSIDTEGQNPGNEGDVTYR